MINKTKYKRFCTKEDDIPLFSKDWWLDAVCDEGEWDVAIVEQNGKIIASMPYYIKKKSIFKVITTPKLTKAMGPYIKYPKGMKYSKKLSFEKKIMNELIAQLPKVDRFEQSFNCNITNLLPFYWNDYKLSMGYIYIIEDLKDIDKAFANLSSDTRRKVRNAEKNGIEIIHSKDIETFYNINKITFEKQNIKIPYSLDFIKNLYTKAKEHQSIDIQFAIKDDVVYSVGLYACDKNFLYLLARSSNREIQLHNSEYLLDWEMIKFASQKNISFNFTGSMIENVERRIHSFGAIQKAYPIIIKDNSKLLKIVQSIK